eukprot:8159968-Pyramimonas_sp.AAC.1
MQVKPVKGVFTSEKITKGKLVLVPVSANLAVGKTDPPTGSVEVWAVLGGMKKVYAMPRIEFGLGDIASGSSAKAA